jgi:Ran GTPase-activating protein (RanGAP) involved in mRNA processing and transport
MAVVTFKKSEDGKRTINGDHVLEYLESHTGSDIRELSCCQVLNDADVSSLDALLRRHYKVFHLQSLKLPRNGLTENAAGALARIVQQSETLVELDLSHNPLRSDGLSSLKHALITTVAAGTSIRSRLQRLDLTDTQIGPKGMASLASILRHNESIRELQLGYNNLGTKSMKTLSTILCEENTTLRKLGLSHNKLKDRGAGLISHTLNPKLSNCKLTGLDLSGNSIGPVGAEQIATALLQGNTHLTSLNLSSNKIGPLGAKHIGWMLRFTHTLEELLLSDNVVGDEGVATLSEGLKRDDHAVSNLRRLELNWNEISDVGAGHLAQVLLENAVLKSLSLASNAIGDRGVVAIAEALPSDLALQYLNISSNQVEDAGAKVLAQALCRPRCQVVLQWDENNLTSAGNERLNHVAVFRKNMAGWLGRQLELIEKQRSLSLSLLSETVGDAEIAVLSTHLAKYQPTVPAIYAGGKGITDESVQALAKDVLVSNTVNLQRIYLQNTRMSDFGAGALAQALLSNSTLTVLSLTNCNITHEGAEKLANGLRRNSTLTRLDLKRNLIGDRGLRAIVTAIHDPPHPSLVSLNVGSNGISDYGLSTLTSFALLEELHLANNNITDRGALECAKACLENHRLRWLSLQGNQLSPKGIQALTLFLPSAGVLESDSQRSVTIL